jgi:hypothetical protein
MQEGILARRSESQGRNSSRNSATGIGPIMCPGSSSAWRQYASAALRTGLALYVIELFRVLVGGVLWVGLVSLIEEGGVASSMMFSLVVLDFGWCGVDYSKGLLTQ